MSVNSKKRQPIIKNNLSNDNDQTKIAGLIKDRIYRAREIITDTIISVQLYRKYNIFSNSEVNICITSLRELHSKTVDTFQKIQSESIETIIDELQLIIDKLTAIISTFGTKCVDDMIYMTFGSSFLEYRGEPELASKFSLIRKYIRPIGFKAITNANHIKQQTKCLCTDKITDEIIPMESAPQFECFNYDLNVSSFHQKVWGIKVVFRCEHSKKTIVMSGIVDEVNLDLLENVYVDSRKKCILGNNTGCNVDVLQRQVDTMTLKDVLVNGDSDVYKRNAAISALASATRTDKLEKTIKKFTSMEVFEQRNILIDLLTYSDDGELKYITYLLYDVITVSNSDSNEQAMIYDSFPWAVKRYFKDAMKYTMNYTHQITQKYDINRVSLEQQVYAMRAPELVKEKAIAKLKEVKNKSDESNGKARQYLEGLLRIPFNTCREEPILKCTKLINSDFKKLIELAIPIMEIPTKPVYTNAEIYSYIARIEYAINERLKNIDSVIDTATKSQIDKVIDYINNKDIKWYKLKTKQAKLVEIKKFIGNGSASDKIEIQSLIKTDGINFKRINLEITKIKGGLDNFHKSLKAIDDVFDTSIHGQTHAKTQLKKVIAQWITGEQKGHCFGFEGSPGIGKTSLAKYGLAKCLTDEDGTTRPFTFIALGGSCNGSTLEGHGFTYLNSTWGAISTALMDAGCKNLIIYFDEADKISKEHGSEINGILTHLTDSTQNDGFQDRFFPGIPLDVSKVLFILSYNDPDSIDKVLLDRIHRIKFENLTIEEKIVIARDYMIPNITKNMGLTDTVIMSDDIIRQIIILFTMEPGVRKLKEILFDLYGAINLELLQPSDIKIPIVITNESLDKYLTKYKRINENVIHDKAMIGIINGLYANSRGNGGIIQIEASFFPASTFLDLKLTGLQGNVMKESMNVAKTLAWSLCPNDIQNKLLADFETNKQGIHVHCAEGSVEKEGPSAGVASVVVMYSLLTQQPICNTVAITGEVDLRGNVTAIGGLEYKITGGIRAGVKTFLYPKENNKDFIEFKDKHEVNDDIKFIEISNICDVFKHVFM
ncbi:MAG: S16 family serine protease [Flavobacterium sp.]